MRDLKEVIAQSKAIIYDKNEEIKQMLKLLDFIEPYLSKELYAKIGTSIHKAYNENYENLRSYFMSPTDEIKGREFQMYLYKNTSLSLKTYHHNDKDMLEVEFLFFSDTSLKQYKKIIAINKDLSTKEATEIELNEEQVIELLKDYIDRP